MPTDEEYREQVREEWRGSHIKVNPQAEVQTTTKGAWVQAWIFVNKDDISDQGQFGVGA